MIQNKIVIKGKRVLPFELIDQIHNRTEGSSKTVFDLIANTLIKNTDYIQSGRKVYLTISGYVFVSNILCAGNPGTEQDDARRKILNGYFATETDSNSKKNPYEIIREQLDILEQEKEDKKSSSSVEIKKHEDKINSMNKQIETSTNINNKVKDEQAIEWISKMQDKMKQIVASTGDTFSNLLNSIYKEMKKEYGFNKDECRKKFVEKYNLSAETETPSILRAVADNQTWKDVFEAAVKKRLDVTTNGRR